MAKEQIKGNIPVLFLCLIIIGAVAAVIGLVPILGPIVVAFITPTLTLGYLTIFLNLTKGEKPKVETLFVGIPIFIKAFLVDLVMGIFVLLWTLLLIVPGVMKAISYMFAPYILAENHEVGVMEALDLSKKMTDGHKMDLFVLSLSFVLWVLLCMVTGGIAIVYVGPYMQATMMNAYNELKAGAGIVTVEAAEAEDSIDYTDPNAN